MSQPERHGKVKLSFWASRELRQKIIDYQQTRKMKALSEAEIDLIEKALSTNIEVLNYQKCKYRSEIPAHYGKFVRCLKLGANILEEQCRACKQYDLIKIPLMTMEKLGETNGRLRQEKEELKNSLIGLTKEAQELESNTKEGLLQKIEDLDRGLRIAQGVLREEREKPAQLEEKIVQLEERICVLETDNDFLRNQKRQELRTMPQTVEPNPQPIKVIEENKKTMIFATSSSQQRLPLPSQQKAPLLPLIIECPDPDVREPVNVEEICKKKCENRDRCPAYERIMVNKAMQKQ